MNTIEVYKCIDCNQIYSCYRSLWNHNKKFHENRKTVTTEIPEIQEVFECRICGKEYKHQQSIYKHEKTCSTLIDKPDDICENKRKTLIKMINRIMNEMYDSYNVKYITTEKFNYEEYKRIMKTIKFYIKI